MTGNDKTATEYYVVYSDKRNNHNPPCRKIEQVHRDLVAQKGWPIKKCFQTLCKDEKGCHLDLPSCRRMNPTKALTESSLYDYDCKIDEDGFMDEYTYEYDNEERCQFHYYQCITDPCPELTRKPTYCVSIGALAPDVLEAFKKKTCAIKRRDGGKLDGGIRELTSIKNADVFFLLSQEEFSVPDKEERYTEAVMEYEKVHAACVKRGFDSEPIRVLGHCVELAAKLQELHKPAIIDSAPSRIETPPDKPATVKRKPPQKRQSSAEIGGKVKKAIELYFDNPKMSRVSIERAVGLPAATLSRGEAKKQFDRAIASTKRNRDKKEQQDDLDDD